LAFTGFGMSQSSSSFLAGSTLGGSAYFFSSSSFFGSSSCLVGWATLASGFGSTGFSTAFGAYTLAFFGLGSSFQPCVSCLACLPSTCCKSLSTSMRHERSSPVYSLACFLMRSPTCLHSARLRPSTPPLAEMPVPFNWSANPLAICCLTNLTFAASMASGVCLK